jgi:S-adenosylmethionine-diacylglycerol 3-amino-3-carboxypropyl transferase
MAGGMKRVGDWVSAKVFQMVHGKNLVYNACWEDPRLDRVALELGPDDTIMVITSAGCNALDYALQSPKKIVAVDMNHRQNALLEMKLAAIRTLEFDDYFQMFGRGWLPNFRAVYRDKLRPVLSPRSRAYWDRHRRYFKGGGWKNSFYFHGTSGTFARVVKTYVDRRKRAREGVNALFAAESVAEQRRLYDEFRPVFWNRFVRWIVRRDSTLSLLGVPRAQRIQVERDYKGGIAKFIEDSVEAVFAKLPLVDNYFWRLYVFGEYTPNCCPEYLTRSGFAALKAGLADRIQTYTGSITQFLTQYRGDISRYILLDHMDWLSTPKRLPLLQEEWQAIVDRAAPKTRILWRSGGLKVDFVDPLEVTVNGARRKVGDLLSYNPALAAELHEKDRVHTYGSFYIADLKK